MGISLYDTRTMLEAVQQMTPAKTFLKDTFFGTPKTFLTEHVDVDIRKGRRKMAPFVNPKVAGKVMDREGFKTSTFTPPSIKPKRVIQSVDLNKRSFGENIYSTRSPEDRAAEILATDLEELDETITRREEWMAAQVLFTGKVDVVGDGVDVQIDYDFGNNKTLSGTSLWSDKDNSNPLSDLNKWANEIVKSSGVSPNIAVFSTDVIEAFVSHPKVKDVLDNRRVVLGEIRPQELPNGATYVGTVNALGYQFDVYGYNEWFYDEEAEVEKPMVPEGKLMIGSTNSRSTMAYGAVNLTDQLTSQFITYEGMRIPDSWIEKDPAARYLQMHAKPLPIPHEVDSWLVATVL